MSAASLDIDSSGFQDSIWSCGIRVVAAWTPNNGSSGATCHQINKQTEWEAFNIVTFIIMEITEKTSAAELRLQLVHVMNITLAYIQLES